MIESNNPFPFQEEYSTPPCSGDIFEVHHFCQKHYNHKCKAHYEHISGVVGFHICPYGFTTHVTLVKTAVSF